jgi:hypothetical protein
MNPDTFVCLWGQKNIQQDRPSAFYCPHSFGLKSVSRFGPKRFLLKAKQIDAIRCRPITNRTIIMDHPSTTHCPGLDDKRMGTKEYPARPPQHMLLSPFFWPQIHRAIRAKSAGLPESAGSHICPGLANIASTAELLPQENGDKRISSKTARAHSFSLKSVSVFGTSIS